MKDIAGYEGLYRVTPEGDVWALPKRVKVGKNGGYRLEPARKLRTYKIKAQYLHQRVYLAKNGRKKPFSVHQLVAQAYLPNPDSLPYVNHLDCNPLNNRVENLEWCDARRNAQHAFANGRTITPDQRGAANSSAKLTEDAVRQIRTRHLAGSSGAEIARAFGLNPKTVSDIVRGKRWAHL